MLRLIFSLIVSLTTLAVAACQTPEHRAAAGWITGRIVDVSGVPLSARLRIDDAEFSTSANGVFAIDPTPDLVYRIEIEADGYYPMRHTFSHAELSDTAALGDIVMVARKPGRTMFVFGGDAMIGRRFYQPFEGEPVLVDEGTRLDDSKTLLAEMKPYLERADYASINLETPIFEAPPGPAAPKSVTFYSAPETLEALTWAGTDYVALGNNHTYDFLEPGLTLTMDHLADSALDYSGAGADETEALRAHRETLAATDYEFLSYVGWPAGPPTQSAESNKGGAALGTRENLVTTTRQSLAGGAVPVLQYHGGLEYVAEPTLAVETLLKQAADAGAPLIVGHHPHVTQGLEVYNDTLIAWSLGNFLFDQYFYSAQSAALLYVWMDGETVHHAEMVPVYIKGYVPTPAVGAMRDRINQRLIDLSAARDTALRPSGGHVILASKSDAPVSFLTSETDIDCRASSRRSGEDLLARGDFDSFALFDAPDRSWLTLDDRVRVQPRAEDPSDFALFADIAAGATLTTGMRKFLRVFPRDNPMSVRADILATTDAAVSVYLQTRAEGQGLGEALESGQKHFLGDLTLRAGEHTRLDVDFDTPRTRTRSIRILLELQAADSDTRIMVDEFKLIAWRTPFDVGKEACRTEAPT